MSKEDATVEQVRMILWSSIFITNVKRWKLLLNHTDTLFDLCRAQMHLQERFIKTIQNRRKWNGGGKWNSLCRGRIFAAKWNMQWGWVLHGHHPFTWSGMRHRKPLQKRLRLILGVPQNIFPCYTSILIFHGVTLHNFSYRPLFWWK